MEVVKGYKAVLSKFDFYESYVTEIKWSKDLFDLVLSVNYFHDVPSGCKNRDIRIILKDCDSALFNVSQEAKQKLATVNRMAISYIAYSIESFDIKEENNKLKVVVGTTINNHKWLEANCRELWVEY